MTAVIFCSDFRAPQNEVSHCFHCFSIYLLRSDGTKCHDINFLNGEFEPDVSLSSFTSIKRLFSSSSLSAMRVVSSDYVQLLIFLPDIFIQVIASSSWAFLMMYSAYKLSNQGDDIQPWHTPFLIWNQSLVPCSVLAVASWPAYRYLRRQKRWSGIPISVSFPQFAVIHTVKGFCKFDEAEVGVFLQFSCFFYEPADVGSLISGSSAFFKSILNIWSFTVHVLLKTRLDKLLW